jgi:hypothetical protein
MCFGRGSAAAAGRAARVACPGMAMTAIAPAMAIAAAMPIQKRRCPINPVLIALGVDAVPQAVGEVEVQRGRRQEQQSPPTTREA